MSILGYLVLRRTDGGNYRVEMERHEIHGPLPGNVLGVLHVMESGHLALEPRRRMADVIDQELRGIRLDPAH